MSDKSSDNESDWEKLGSRRMTKTWRSGRASRYERESRLPMRACRLRIVAADTDDDTLDDSDLQFNDEVDPYMRTRRSYRRVTRGHTRGSAVEQRPNQEDSQQQNGMKEGEEDDEGGEQNIRRSTRQKKLQYGSFNQSWIVGTRSSLRGYRNLYGSDHDAEQEPGHTSNSNDATNIGATEPNNENSEEQKPENRAEKDNVERKRSRRPRIQFSPEPVLRGRLRPVRRTRMAVRAVSDSESESAASSDDGRHRRQTRRVYHLRQNKPIVERFQISSNEPTRRSSRHVLCEPFTARSYINQRKRRDSTSDEERFQRKKAMSLAKARSRCMPLNFNQNEAQSLQKTPTHSNSKQGIAGGPKGPADVDSMSIDSSVTFEKVGGLESHLRCLKEMVVFPMLYREVFEQYNVQPPKGILFHGPPGTGKTLIARALANECSHGDRKVSFFMRKGADCLSKWIGESERQLRLLFEQAHQMRPSIIFFDEIDGLAPVRSSKQDQIHSSIVSTLLALLDGLDDRGDIIVIGATNRIDAIDPALRRPGRFDRELYFPLPGKKERVEILKIHTKPWANPPTCDVVRELAERCVGYCGADLRLLCSEAVVGAMRRRYPQIYGTSEKLLLQPDQVKVVDEDFREAHLKIVPASCRATRCFRATLSRHVASLLTRQFQLALNALKSVFPHASAASIHDSVVQRVHRPRLLVYGESDEFGQTSHVAPALLDAMEHLPVHIISLATLLDTTNRSPEEAVIQIIQEATRNPPSVLFLPGVDTWWEYLPATTQKLLLDCVGLIAADASVLLLATAHSPLSQLYPQVKLLFPYDHVEVKGPTLDEINEFWRPIFLEETVKDPPAPPVVMEELEPLPLAPPPAPPTPSAQQLEELHNSEEHRLRGLRLFLRDICGKLARNRQFCLFSKPVDVKEVPDYLKIIKRPMDLETMMMNIDSHVYNCAQEFLLDIDLIVSNALEYNPVRDSEDKLIRHSACRLRDTAYTLIKAEMDTDFEEECRKISKRRRDAKEKEEKTEENTKEKDEEMESPVCNGDLEISNNTSADSRRQRSSSQPASSSNPRLNGTVLSSERMRRRKHSSWAKGMINGKRKPKAKTDEVDGKTESSPPSLQEASTECTKNRGVSPLERENKKPRTETDNEVESPKKESPGSGTEDGTPKKRARKVSARKLRISEHGEMVVDLGRLEEVRQLVVRASDGWTVHTLLECSARLRRVVDNYIHHYDRTQLPGDMEMAFNEFVALP